MKKTLAAAAIGAAVLAFAACGPDATQLDDAPVGQLDDAPVFVLTNPDGFLNVGIRCYGKNGLYMTTSSEKALTIVVDDPECGGNGKSSAEVTE